MLTIWPSTYELSLTFGEVAMQPNDLLLWRACESYVLYLARDLQSTAPGSDRGQV